MQPSGLRSLLSTVLALAALWLGGDVGSSAVSVGATVRPSTNLPDPGYWLGASDGGVFAFGAAFFGNPQTVGSNICEAPTTLNPFICRGIAATHDGNGYWIVSSETFEGGINGRVSGFGDATLAQPPAPLSGLNAQLVGVAAGGSDGGELWLAGADGGVFAYGDAPFFGSVAGLSLRDPVVGIVADPVANGYWLVAADGGVFAFGAAQFLGSLSTSPLAHPVVGMAATPDGGGYWLVTSDGGVYNFGDASYLGSMAFQPYLGQIPLTKPVVGMAATPDGQGYWLVAGDGGIFAFGDAPFLGSMGGMPLNGTVVGITARQS